MSPIAVEKSPVVLRPPAGRRDLHRSRRRRQHSWSSSATVTTGARVFRPASECDSRDLAPEPGAFGCAEADTKVQGGQQARAARQILYAGMSPQAAPNPRTCDNAREAAPGKIQSLDRLVSVEDFESEALAISGVTKAAGAWQLADNIPEVVVTVLMETGRGDEFGDVRATLAGYSRNRGPGRFPIAVLQGHLEYVVINADVRVRLDVSRRRHHESDSQALGVNSGKPNVRDDQSGLFSCATAWLRHREYATSHRRDNSAGRGRDLGLRHALRIARRHRRSDRVHATNNPNPDAADCGLRQPERAEFVRRATCNSPAWPKRSPR